MDNTSFWWFATGLLVAIELATGTFYLLMLALGMAAAALAAHLNLEPNTQVTLAALVGFGAVVALYLYRKRAGGGTQVTNQHDANDLDAGQTVVVHADQLSDQGATVHYRGSSWPAQSVTGSALSAGPHRIVRVDGARLLLEPL